MSYSDRFRVSGGHSDALFANYTPPFTGGVRRSIESRLADFVSVADFEAVNDGDDAGGGTDNTAALQAAIDHAMDTGAALWFPAGIYFTASPLTNLHAVRKFGPGAIASTAFFVTYLFYVDPKHDQTNTLFVATTGSDSNDGLAGRPFLTVTEPFDLLPAYGPVLGGTWKVSVGVGTYTSGVNHYVASANPVQLLGPDWFGTVSAPTVVLTGGGTQSSMITCRDLGNLDVENIKATNCEDNVIQYVNGATGTLTRIHSTDAAQTGVSGACLYVANGSKVIVDGECLFRGALSAEGCVLVYHATLSMGTNNDVDDAPHVENPGEARCVQVVHASLVKLRTVHIDGGTYGVDISTDSHISHEKGSIDNVTYAYFRTGAGLILMQLSVVTIGSGVTSLRFAGDNNGIQDRPIQTDFTTWKSVGIYSGASLTNSSITNTTADIVSIATSLLDKDFNAKGRGLKIVVYASKGLLETNGGITFTMSGSVGGSIRSIVLAATDTGDMRIELSVRCLDTGSSTRAVLTEGVALLDQHYPQYVTVATTDDLSVAQNISVSATVASGDTLTIHAVEAWQAGI